MRAAPGDAMRVRAAEASEIDQLAAIWYDGWQDAHAPIMPAELARLRTRDSFRERLGAALADVSVAGAPGSPVGFCILKGDELYQMYVAAEARGTGVADALMADAEARLAARGVELAWLACAVGNDRAARFYEKSGWRRAGVVSYQPDAASGTGPIQVWRYEKVLRIHHQPAMTMQARGTFEVKLSPQGGVEGHDASLGRLTLDKRYHGDLEGSSRGQMLTAMTAVEGSAGYVAIENFSGTLHGRSGTFALQHSGTMSGGRQQLTIAVVPDSGTGELAGVSGQMAILIADGKHSYSLDYALPAAT